MRFVEIATTAIVLICWPVYLALFIRPVMPGRSMEQRNPKSMAGIIIQFSAVLIVWMSPRRDSLSVFSPLSIGAAILAVMSVWFSWRALRALGSQWSFVAGVNAAHRLVREGPYSRVRHPLYICFFGLTVATALVWSSLPVLIVVIPLFMAGVRIRIGAEERLLREKFGDGFDEYVRTVPAILPKLKKD